MIASTHNPMEQIATKIRKSQLVAAETIGPMIGIGDPFGVECWQSVYRQVQACAVPPLPDIGRSALLPDDFAPTEWPTPQRRDHSTRSASPANHDSIVSTRPTPGSMRNRNRRHRD